MGCPEGIPFLLRMYLRRMTAGLTTCGKPLSDDVATVMKVCRKPGSVLVAVRTGTTLPL